MAVPCEHMAASANIRVWLGLETCVIWVVCEYAALRSDGAGHALAHSRLPM